MHSNIVILLLGCLCFVLVQAIPTIGITGSKFFTSDGNQFFIKGVAYQLVEDDPLVDAAQCERDAALMKQLGANSIRVYHVNATADHSECMNAFAEAGIYLWVDLDSFKTYIRLADGPSWTQDKLASFQAVMDNFQQFDNTAGFFVGNEVLNSLNDSGSAPYLLSAKASLAAYAKSKGYRPVPIGYSATDTGALPMLQDYLVCRPDVSERLDFYALNSYRWCGQSSFEQSGYNIILNSTENFPVPLFFSEVGCNTQPPRTFADQAAIFNQMAGVWSGAIIYEWIQEMNHYGLITYGPQQDASVNEGSEIVQGFTRQGNPTPVAPDFTNLQNQWATLHPTGVVSSAYAATVKTEAPACPASTAGGWTVNANAALPAVGPATGTNPEPPVSVPSGRITVQSSSSLAGPTTAMSNESGSSQTLNRSSPNLPHTGSSAIETGTSDSSPSSSSTSTSVSNSAANSPVPTIIRSSTIGNTLLAMAILLFVALTWL